MYLVTCCSRNCLWSFSEDEKDQCAEMFVKKSVHQQRQFLLDLIVASQPDNHEHNQVKTQTSLASPSYLCTVNSTHTQTQTESHTPKHTCGVQTLTVCVECISYVNVLRVLVLSYA